MTYNLRAQNQMETNQTNIFLEFQKTCQAYPQKTCLKFKKYNLYDYLTYASLYEKVFALRRILLDSGIKPGERVAILLSNGPYWPVAFFAVLSIQAVAVPIDVQLSAQDVKGLFIHSNSRFLLTEEKFGPSLKAVFAGDAAKEVLFLERLERSDQKTDEVLSGERHLFPQSKLAALFYTSGTTQEHKAVMLTHKNLLSNFHSIRKLNIFTREDVVLSLLPLHHTYPFMVTCLAPLLEGAVVCYLPNMTQHEISLCMKENRVTIFVGVPQLFSLIERSIQERLKKYGIFSQQAALLLRGLCSILSGLSGRNGGKLFFKTLHENFGGHLRFMVSGGAKLDPAVAHSLYSWGFDIIEGYGLTETSPVVTFNPINSSKLASVGKPVPGVQVKIANVTQDKNGEIAVKGDNVMLGYYRSPSLTKSVLKDGWFLTGDEGYLDEANYLYITGRLNELIVLPSGKKISPEQIEAHYLSSPFIKEICVFFAKPSSRGEALKKDLPVGPSDYMVAAIVPDEDYLKAKKYVNIYFKIRWELEALSQKLPPYQRIKGFVLSKEPLERTRLGKLVRYRIEEKFRDDIFKEKAKDRGEQEKLSPFEEKIIKYLSEVLKRDIRMEDHLELDLGLDSLGRIEFLSSLQNLINVEIDDALALELFHARTIREIIEKASQALPESAFIGLAKKDETAFWLEALGVPIEAQEKRKLKFKFDLFDKFVSFVEILILKFIFRVMFCVKVRGKDRIPQDGPFVITPNHTSYFDPFFVLCSLPFRLILKTYFVGFGDIFNHPLIAWAMRFHRLIPIDANLNLVESLKICRYLLQEGKILVYFPEGQRSIDGKLKEFRKGVGILAKEADAKVLPIYLAGAYKTWPRIRAFPLPAKVTARIGKCVSPQELNFAKGEDGYSVLANSLKEKMEELEKASF